MKFRCERDVLVEALGVAGRAAAGRGSSLPVLSGVRVALVGNSLEITGTDLELTISVNVEVSGSSDGVVVLPGRLASDIVRALPDGSVEIEVDNDEAQITAGRSKFSLRVLPADEFPRIAAATGTPVSLASDELALALSQVVRAASSDDARPILTGVLLAAEPGGLRLVATDSYRLAIRDLPGTNVLDEGQHVLIPSRALQELARVLSAGDKLTVCLGERDASFEVGGTRLTTVLIEGEFPPYERLIPQSQPNRLTVGREVFLEAVRRVKLLAREATPVRLAMSSEGLELVAVTQDVGQAHESIDATFVGSDLTVAFNPEYLLQGIEVAPGDEVTIETVDALKPAILRVPEHPEFLYLLMPVRVS